MFKKLGISLLVATYMIGSVGMVYAKPAVTTIDIKKQEEQGVMELVKINRVEIKKFLMEENGYDEYRAELMSDTVMRLEVKFQPLIDTYVKDKTFDENFAVDGVTLKIVMEKWDYDFWEGLEELNKDRNQKETLTMPNKIWLKFDEATIKKILMEENHYDKKTASKAVYALRRCDGFVQPVLDAYLEDRRVLGDFNLKGLSMERIMELWHCDFWCALDKLGNLYYKYDEMLKMTLDDGIPFNDAATWGAEGYYPDAFPGGHLPRNWDRK